MADLETLKGLMLRAQEAKEADRALDEAIMAAFYVRDSRHIGARDCTAPTLPLALTVAALMVHVSALIAQAEQEGSHG